jgi:Transglutaminase-like superfamily
MNKDSFVFVTLGDYQGLKNPSLARWRRTKKIPTDFWNEIKDIPRGTNIAGALLSLRMLLLKNYGSKRYAAKSFSDSRFTSLSKMIARGMVSCGAFASIFGETLRNFGVPVKFIHGRYKGQKGDDRHAWLELYNPNERRWFPVDPTTQNFWRRPDARKIKTYLDWSELKKDYRKGKF